MHMTREETEWALYVFRHSTWAWTEDMRENESIASLQQKLTAALSPKHRKPRTCPHADKLQPLNDLIASGVPKKHAAKQLGIARSTLYRMITQTPAP